ncbi:MAG: hypothetical protein ACXWWC_10545, partial [Chitinophagaceae bacterium]
MKKLFSAVLFLFIFICSYSQQLRQITFSGASTLSYFTFVIDQSLLIRISEDGKLLEWGTELMSERSSNYFAPKL